MSTQTDEVLFKGASTQAETAELQHEAGVTRPMDEVVELPSFALRDILQRVNADTGNEVLKCMEVCKDWCAAVKETALELHLVNYPRLKEALLQISSFEGLRTLYVRDCQWSGENWSRTEGLDLGRRCPQLSAIHFIGVELTTENVADLLRHCRTISTLELTVNPNEPRRVPRNEVQLSPLDHLTSLQSLILSSNLYQPALPPIHTLSLLQSLDLSGSHYLGTLPPLSGFPFLQHLNVSYCFGLKEVDLTYSPPLQSLIVTRCKDLQKIVGLEALTSLHTFAACECNCMSLDTWPRLSAIQSLQNVEIDVQHSRQIVGLEAIQSLRRLKLNIKNIQVSLEPLPDVEELSVELCELDDVPNLPVLRGLREVEIYDCGVTSLVQLAHLTQLQRIDVSGGRLLEGVFLLDALANLTRLSLDRCIKLENPPALDGTPNLRHLDFRAWQQLESLPPMVHLHRLTHLDVSCCEKLKLLPALPHSLQTLMFERCESLELLPRLDSLVHLQRIEGNWSGITELPPLSGLISLRELVLKGCQDLVAVPELGGALSMRVLKMSGCEKLQHLPPLGMLRRLRSVELILCPCLTDFQFLEGLCEEAEVSR